MNIYGEVKSSLALHLLHCLLLVCLDLSLDVFDPAELGDIGMGAENATCLLRETVLHFKGIPQAFRVCEDHQFAGRDRNGELELITSSCSHKEVLREQVYVLKAKVSEELLQDVGHVSSPYCGPCWWQTGGM